MPRFRACEPRILNTLFGNSAHLCYQASSEKGAGRVDLGVRFCCTPAWWMKKTTDKDSSATHPRRPEETQDDEHNNSLRGFFKISNNEHGLLSLSGGESEASLHTHTHTRFVLSQVLGSGRTEPCLLLPRTAGCFIRA